MIEATLLIISIILLGIATTSRQNEFPLEGGVLYPRASETRQVIKLDGIWNFRQDSDPQKGIEEKWFKDDLASNGPVILMPVPSSYNDITQDKSLRDHVGVVWYDRRFFVPETWEKDGFRVWLRFSSVHYFAQVWVNGKKVVEHEFGHLPFQAEVTDVLKYGKENRVTVYVDNVLTIDTIPQGCLDKIQTDSGSKIVQRYSFDFFNYAGIHRSVFLYTTPNLYIDDITLDTDISGSSAYVNYNVSYKGASGSPKEMLNLTVDIWDADDVSQCFETVTIENGEPGAGFITGRIEITNAKFWWPYLMDEEPGYLYTLRVSMKSSETDTEDVYYLPFGARSIKWTDTSLLINGKPIYIHGFGRHEDADIRGKGLDLVIAVKDYNLLKWIGANAYRTSHYPYAEELMDLADQQGIMIIDECASVNTENFTQSLLKKHKLAMAETIRRDKNRPSVIMWSVANEPRTADKESGPYFGSVVAFTRKLDKTRPITAVLNRWFTVDQAGQHMDIISFNRYNSWYTEPGETETIRISVESEAENWHKKYKKPVIMTEYGVETLVGLHSNPEYVWTEEYLEKVLSEHFKAFDNLRKKKFFIGEMIWNFADFMTDQAITRVGGNRKGIFTRQRQPKCAAHLVRIRYFQLAKSLHKAESPPDLLTYTFSEKGHSEL